MTIARATKRNEEVARIRIGRAGNYFRKADAHRRPELGERREIDASLECDKVDQSVSHGTWMPDRERMHIYIYIGSANHYNINNLVCVVKAYTTLGVAIGVVIFFLFVLFSLVLYVGDFWTFSNNTM